MMTFSRKHKIIAVAVLLLVAVVLVLNSVLARKPTLSVSSGVKNKKSVKVTGTANKKTKISDSNQIAAGSEKNNKAKKTSKTNKSADKNSQIADSNSVSDSNQIADLVKKLMPTVSDAGNGESAQGGEQVAKTAEMAGQLLGDSKITDMIKTLASSVTADANAEKTSTNNEVFSSDQIAAISKSLLTGKDSDKRKAEMPLDAVGTQSEAKITQSGTQSLVFAKNMPIVDALQLLGARYSKNIVPTAKVAGNLVFTRLNNVNFEEAMNAILGENFRYQEQGSMIKVYAADEYRQVMPKSNEMTCKVFTLYYISAAEAKKMITPVISAEGKVEITTAALTGVPVEESISAPDGGGDTLAINDMMVVYDYPQRIESVEQILAAIDIRPKQVLIEATIMTATLTDGMQFGIDWRNLKGAVISGLTNLNYGSPDNLSFGGSTTATGSGALTGGMTIGVVHDDIAAFIKAVESVTDVTILANPKILAANKQLGQVYIGTKVGYLSSTTQTDTSTTQSVSFLDTGTKLSFRPYIGNDGYIRMDIHPKDSSAVIRQLGDDTSTVAVPDETSAELISNIIVKDGETIVIGGLFRNRIQTAKTQVPVLGNIPIVGTAFSSTADEARREEVIVLLTPHVIGDPRNTDGDERAAEVARMNIKAKEEMHPANKTRLAEECYEKAALYYAKGKNREALKELNSAIGLCPTYLEAIELQERINSESDPKWKPRRKIVDEVQQPKSSKWRRK